jgi:hypothetical protein
MIFKSVIARLQEEQKMATTMHFDEIVKDQGGKKEMELEIGRSSFYPKDSIYIRVDGKTAIMDQK